MRARWGAVQVRTEFSLLSSTDWGQGHEIQEVPELPSRRHPLRPQCEKLHGDPLNHNCRHIVVVKETGPKAKYIAVSILNDGHDFLDFGRQRSPPFATRPVLQIRVADDLRLPL